MRGVDLDSWINIDARMELVGETIPFPLQEEGQDLKIGFTIDTNGEKAIGKALSVNVDLFVWTTTDLLRVDPRMRHVVYPFSKKRNQFRKWKDSWKKKGDKLPSLKLSNPDLWRKWGIQHGLLISYWLKHQVKNDDVRKLYRPQ